MKNKITIICSLLIMAASINSFSQYQYAYVSNKSKSDLYLVTFTGKNDSVLRVDTATTFYDEEIMPLHALVLPDGKNKSLSTIIYVYGCERFIWKKFKYQKIVK